MTRPDAAGERFPRSARIRSTREIRAVFREGCRHRSGPLELFVRPSPAARPRVAFVVPRHGRPIADRNRMQRRLREIARREWLPAALERDVRLDVVVRARPEAYGASFAELRSALRSGLEDLPWDDASSSG